MGANESSLPASSGGPPPSGVTVRIGNAWLRSEGGSAHSVYRVDVTFRQFRYSVQKRFSEFDALNRSLARVYGDRLQALPAKTLWGRPIDEATMRRRAVHLERYLQHVVGQVTLWNDVHVREWLEVGAISFEPRFGQKRKEGYCNAVFVPGQGSLFADTDVFKSAKGGKRWVVLKDRFIALFHASTTLRPDEVFLVDAEFRTEMSGMMIHVHNATGVLQLAASSRREVEAWGTAVMDAYGSFARKPGVEPDPRTPFAPIRQSVDARWYVDGKDHYAAVVAALDGARESIFITGWWISPEVLLTRPPGATVRLDNVLAEAAERGVDVRILVYKEVELALPLASLRVKELLSGLHANVQVLRHPDMGTNLWTHHEKLVIVDQRLAFLGGIDLCFGRYDDAAHRLDDETSLVWPGKDYYNPSHAAVTALHEPFSDLIDRHADPRMPWHDVSVAVTGAAAADAAYHFVQRWNAHRRGKGVQRGALLLPYGDAFVGYVQADGSVPREWVQPVYAFPDAGGLLPEASGGQCAVQICRSVSRWSAGVETEASIHHQYVQAIRGARHLVYIEAQFFISAAAGVDDLWNGIAAALLDRIRQAIRNKHTLRVIVLLPVHPEGNYRERGVRTVMHYTYRTILRHRESMIMRLRAEFPGIDTAEYLGFFSLRQHGLIAGRLVTEQIYVHSKVLIVDDRVAIIGSANINDRSMSGDRDSEIAAVVRDHNVIRSTMDGTEFDVSEFAHTLRVQLWREHLGIEPGTADAEAIRDPVCTRSYFELWRRRADLNTTLFEQIFPVVPSSSLRTFRQIVETGARFNLAEDKPPPCAEERSLNAGAEPETEADSSGAAETEAEQAAVAGEADTVPDVNRPGAAQMERDRDAIQQVVGHLVHFPLDFLCDEDLRPDFLSVENLLPAAVFQ